MEDDQQQRPESLLPYETWIAQALRHVVAQAIEHVAAAGLPGGHHFYLTFRTDHPGVQIPQRLAAQYPHEMTIVLQHQFWDLGFNRATQAIEVGLSFGGVPSRLVIPLDAVVEFADPHIRYGLRFQTAEPAPPPAAAGATAAEGAEPGATKPHGGAPHGGEQKDGEQKGGEHKAAEPAQVVSLDAFRRRSPQD
jgi:hypothetical protein